MIFTQTKILIKFDNKLSKPVEINKRVRQGCPLSPTMFNHLNGGLNPICHLLALLGAHPTLHVSRIRVNVYLDEIITKWQNQDITEIKFSKKQNKKKTTVNAIICRQPIHNSRYRK